MFKIRSLCEKEGGEKIGDGGGDGDAGFAFFAGAVGVKPLARPVGFRLEGEERETLDVDRSAIVEADVQQANETEAETERETERAFRGERRKESRRLGRPAGTGGGPSRRAAATSGQPRGSLSPPPPPPSAGNRPTKGEGSEASNKLDCGRAAEGSQISSWKARVGERT